MRICMVSPHLPPERGPSASLPAMLGSELRGSDVESDYVAYLPDTPFGPAPVPGTWRVPHQGRSSFARSRAGAGVAALRIARVARLPIARADLVHLHSSGLVIEVAAALAKRYGKPWIVTLYDSDLRHYEPRRDRRYTRLVRGAACRAFYSAALRDRAEALGLAEPPVVVTRAPAPRAFQRPQASERSHLRRALGVEGPLLLTIKRMRPVAGHEVLLTAMPQVVARHPDVSLVLAGDGEMRPSLEGLAAKLRIADRVRFIGALDEGHAARWSAAADLCVLPSHVESWPTQAIEALTLGTPVVTTDTAGGTEVHDCFPGDVGLVARGDANALATAILRWLGEPRRTSEATRQRLEQEFTPHALARVYLDVYRQALGDSSSPVSHASHRRRG